MPISIRNTLATLLDIPGAGLLFAPGEEKTVDALSPELSAAIRSGRLEVTAQEATALIVVENDGDSEFDLPLSWPGADSMHMALNGLLMTFGEDYTVDPASNRLLWLDEEIALVAGDTLQLIGGAP